MNMRIYTTMQSLRFGDLIGRGWLTIAVAGILLVGVFIAPVSAQVSVGVGIDATKQLGTVPQQLLGLNVSAGDSKLMDDSVPALLKTAGFHILRFPGGSIADDYHWKTNSLIAGSAYAVDPNDSFDSFAALAKKVAATPLITVNYGSNVDGSAGGDPQEAADWVRYSNTKNYGIKYWEIGNEVYGNGFYGKSWETDLHVPAAIVRKGSFHLSPRTYGSNVNLYARAMKAADPSIKIGAVLALPGDFPDGMDPDWNEAVLQSCGNNIDFVSVHLFGKGDTEGDLLATPDTKTRTALSAIRDLITNYCGTNAKNIAIWITEDDAGDFNTHMAGALYAADQTLACAESGASNLDWWDLHNGIAQNPNNTIDDKGLLSNGSAAAGVQEPAAETAFPPYYGLQMVNLLIGQGGGLLATSADQDFVKTHAIQQSKGFMALMIINEDPSRNALVNVTIYGAQIASSATLYEYGNDYLPSTTGASKPISKKEVFGQDSTYFLHVRPYTIVDLIVKITGTASEQSG